MYYAIIVDTDSDLNIDKNGVFTHHTRREEIITFQKQEDVVTTLNEFKEFCVGTRLEGTIDHIVHNLCNFIVNKRKRWDELTGISGTNGNYEIRIVKIPYYKKEDYAKYKALHDQYGI